MADDRDARIAELEAEVACLRDLAEADGDYWHRKDAATADVLHAVATTPADLKRVLDAIGQAAADLGGADRVSIQLRHGDELLAVDSSTGALVGDGTRIPITPGTFSGRALLERRILHVPDLDAMGEEFADGLAIARSLAPDVAWRSGVFAPLLKGDEAVGILLIARA